ncbi:MAG: FAD-dependent oxidoreductase [Hyphomicrobium sp.]|nr:FAD-dependent oxidoreductase [Hyphomicrobium sp.]
MPASKPTQAPPVASADAESENITADICVIGAGPGGLAVATGAAAFGRSVVLVERHKFGGDALNYGCIPSRALAAVANRAHAMRSAAAFGIAGRDPEVDMRTVNAHVESVVAGVAPNFAAERFTGLGVRVIHAAARFINKKTVVAGEYRIRARRFVIATGSAPSIPAIPGLDSVPYFTNETIFANQERLHSLIIIGGGPTGLELAQTHSRLGSRVMVLEADKALADEDPELSKFVLEQLAEEGVSVHEGTKVESIEGALGRVRVNVSVGGEKHVVEGSHLLLAVGRRPSTSDLGLEAAGIRHDGRGIKVNAGLKTSNRRVFAIGDVAGGAPYVQVADYHAGIVVRRALLRLPARVDERLIPRATFTDPEIAYVGLSEVEAAKRAQKIHVLRWPYRENDRAQAERTTVGHVKIITSRDGKILGAGIVGAQAGELIQMWSLAITQGLNIKAMTSWIAPYPTLAEINKRVAASYYAATPASPTLRKVINFLAKLG